MKDQNGTVHEYTYDEFGRMIHDRVTSVGTGIEGTARRITRSYENRGMLTAISTHDDRDPGDGSSGYTRLEEITYLSPVDLELAA